MADPKHTFKVHHGGQFTDMPLGKMYLGGKVDFINDIDPDLMSYFEMVIIIKELGCAENEIMYHCLPDCDLDGGLRVINTDIAVRDMFAIHEGIGTIAIYVVGEYGKEDDNEGSESASEGNAGSPRGSIGDSDIDYFADGDDLFESNGQVTTEVEVMDLEGCGVLSKGVRSEFGEGTHGFGEGSSGFSKGTYGFDAYEWLMRESPSVWCRSMFSPRAKSDMLANNVSESFNHYIRQARDKPIITMLEMIRRQLMSRYEEKRSWILTCNGTLCPKIQKIIEEMKVEARNCEVAYAGNHIYEVWHGVRTLVVDLANHTCVCRKWDVTGIPCAHAVAAITSAKRQPESYVNECYNRDSYMRAYAPIIHPIPDQTEWVHTEFDPIVPPPLRRPPGRPKKARRRGPDEPNNPHLAKRTHQSLRCSNCQELGHNTRTCKGPVAPKKGMGRGNTRGRGTTRGSTSQSSGITIDNSRPIAGMTSIMWNNIMKDQGIATGTSDKGKGIAAGTSDMGKEIEAGSGSRGRGRGARGRGRGARGRGSGAMARGRGGLARGSGAMARGSGGLARGNGAVARGSGAVARGRTAQLVPSQGSSSATQIGLSQTSSNIPQNPTSEYAAF
ncbi:hypothetical protein RHMOL_Rhmol06G0252600 [Rhododendron molle]|uniref:Uncharacterized protein n=1 Tax=Rhododendron molle TaxID=49168 RepID=A0ACC0NGX3_RHOML|nr:hypothetical protein RHMOL_Rhmol06G0252600 [Rhododendron molle]